MDTTKRDAAVRRLYTKLLERDRLRQLAAEYRARPASEQDVQLLRVRGYLEAWVQHQAEYRPRLGAPTAAAFASESSRATTASEYYERSDAWAMEQVEQAVEEDLPALPDGRVLWLALRMRWLNIRVGPRVFRSGRLEHLEPSDVDEFADLAERALIPIFTLRKLPLL